MAHARLAFAVLVIVSLFAIKPGDSQKCHAAAELHLSQHGKEPSPLADADVVFFLHVPRSAGRTFHSCFLSKGVPLKQRCPHAWDHLNRLGGLQRLNCKLLTSHDDYSLTSKLPDKVAVISQIRDPLDRFLSAYEFAIDQAVRSMLRPRRPGNPKKIETGQVWPWNHLLPFFASDITERAAKLKAQGLTGTMTTAKGAWIPIRHPTLERTFYYNKVKGISKWNLTAEEAALQLPALDPYDNPLVMPLKEFVANPIAAELLHDGQTLQVLGLTNYSHYPEASELRACVRDNAGVRARLLEAALRRVDKFTHVGVTNQLLSSAAAAGAALGFNIHGPAAAGAVVPGNLRLRAQNQPQSEGTLEHAYQTCMQNSRIKRANTRVAGPAMSLHDGRELRFDKASRERVPEAIKQQIRDLNLMDQALHAHAEKLLAQHRQDLQRAGTLVEIEPWAPPNVTAYVNPRIPLPTRS